MYILEQNLLLDRERSRRDRIRADGQDRASELEGARWVRMSKPEGPGERERPEPGQGSWKD